MITQDDVLEWADKSNALKVIKDLEEEIDKEIKNNILKGSYEFTLVTNQRNDRVNEFGYLWEGRYGPKAGDVLRKDLREWLRGEVEKKYQKHLPKVQVEALEIGLYFNFEGLIEGGDK